MINSKNIYISDLITLTKGNCSFVLLFLEGYACANTLQIQGMRWDGEPMLLYFLSIQLFYLYMGLSMSADMKWQGIAEEEKAHSK